MNSRFSFIALAAATAMAHIVSTAPANAASSSGCEGGGFKVTATNTSINADGTFSIAAANLATPSRIDVIGKYVQFAIVPESFAIENWLFTGAANPLDITGNRVTVVWERKTPDHKGLKLSDNAVVERSGDSIVVSRAGRGLSMKIQAKDCAQGGIFQMEPQRSDGQTTRIEHVLANGLFYFDNPNFRAREGDSVPYKDTTVVVTARVNIANDLSDELVARDSPQVATRVQEPSCANRVQRRDGQVVTVQHCGRVSLWDVASGGRMGFVTGEDAVEVAPPATACTSKCQAQNRVRGRSVKLGFPFPVPDASRLKPPLPLCTIAMTGSFTPFWLCRTAPLR